MNKKLFLLLCLILSVLLLTIAVSADASSSEYVEEGTDPVTRIVFSLLFGGITAGIVCLLVVRSYGIKHKPVEYPFKEFTDMKLRENSDVFVGKNVSKRVIPSNKNNSRN